MRLLPRVILVFVATASLLHAATALAMPADPRGGCDHATWQERERNLTPRLPATIGAIESDRLRRRL